jgi:hypothetical protein
MIDASVSATAFLRYGVGVLHRQNGASADYVGLGSFVLIRDVTEFALAERVCLRLRIDPTVDQFPTAGQQPKLFDGQWPAHGMAA